jgi:hypothetical protein
MPKQKVYLLERKNYYAIKLRGHERWNIGLLQKADGVLAANNGETGSLADLILKAGGNFKKIHDMTFVKSPNGATRSCGGTSYIGWVDFGNPGKAIAYLKRYFRIEFCK